MVRASWSLAKALRITPNVEYDEEASMQKDRLCTEIDTKGLDLR